MREVYDHDPDKAKVGEAGVIGGLMPRETLLARTLVGLADTLVADFDVVELLSRLADRCVEVLEVGAAGLMLAGPVRVVTAATPRLPLIVPCAERFDG